MLSECKRIEEGYKKAMEEVQQSFEVLNEKHAATVRALQNQYAEKEEQMRLKYKDKC